MSILGHFYFYLSPRKFPKFPFKPLISRNIYTLLKKKKSDKSQKAVIYDHLYKKELQISKVSFR